MKKIRKANFSHKELSVRLTELQQNCSTLMAKLQNGTTNKKKQELWSKTVTAVSNVGQNPRSADELKKKWADMKIQALKYKGHVKGTGGGPPVKEPPFIDKVLDIIGENSELNGVENGSKMVRGIQLISRISSTKIIAFLLDPFQGMSGIDFIFSFIWLDKSFFMRTNVESLLRNKALQRDLFVPILKDLDHKKIMAPVWALAVVGKTFSGPWMAKFYSSTMSNLEMVKYQVILFPHFTEQHATKQSSKDSRGT